MTKKEDLLLKNEILNGLTARSFNLLNNLEIKNQTDSTNDDAKKRLTGLDLRPDREESKILNERSEFSLIGHSGPVYSVHISIDDKFLISGS